MDKSTLKIILSIFLSVLFARGEAQISDIKDLAGGAADALSGCSGSDVSAGCDAFNCCWNGGFHLFDFLIEHHHEIMEMRNLNPCLVSFETDLNMALSYHFSYDSGQFYHYINYLPDIKGNIGIFGADFRFNVLTETVNGVPDLYKSWDLIMMINLVPVKTFKLSLGSGVYAETYTKKYYNEYYLLMRFGLRGNRDFFDLDARLAADYTTSLLPFVEAGIRYKLRIMDLPHVYAYWSVGGIYQAYYVDHQIFGINVGILLNIH